MPQARELLKEMQLRGALSNSSTYDILISGWCDLSNQPELDRASKMSCLTEIVMSTDSWFQLRETRG
ncbi:hypothetical protein V6N11_009461 [Hibiscus sabdariffa]|uniref:Pentatricopeptide repeat-containing protein n=1 Tax=Hibiscus sabdariffa TaxID=183260 RepID=A0ABR2P5Z9_9ROSI